jgi:uncharacterized damage-inducible protein DinB
VTEIESRLDRLQTTVQRLVDRVEHLPADVLYREPAPGEWPVMSTLAHLSELLPYWAQEAAGIANAPGTAFGRTHDDPRRLGAIDEHGRDSAADIGAQIKSALADCVRILRTIPPELWSNAGMHPRRGSMSVEQVVDDFLISHADEHAAQIQSTLDALQGTREVA